MRTTSLNAVGWFHPVRRSRGALRAAAWALLLLGPLLQVGEAQSPSYVLASVADKDGNLHCLWRRGEQELHYAKITARGAVEFDIESPLPEFVFASGSLAMDSRGTIHIVCNEGQYQTPSDSMYLFSFSPHGCLLSSRVLPSRYGGVHGLTAVCDPFDNLWIIGMNQRGVNHDLFCTKISPLGEVLLDEKRLNNNPREDENPSAISDPAGNIYVAWSNTALTEFPYLDSEVYGLKLANDGKVLVAARNLSRTLGRSWRQSLVLTRSGEVMLAWDELAEFLGPVQVQLIRLSPNLERIGTEVVLGSRGLCWAPSLAADANGAILCVFACRGDGLLLARLNETAEVVAPAHVILPEDPTTEASYPILHVTSSSLRLTAIRGSNAYFLEFDRELDELRTSLSLDESAEPARRTAECETRFLRGDCNDDGAVDISDAVCVLNWLFLGGAAPVCVAVTNTNGDSAENISDATYLLNHLFLGGPQPVMPFPECGPGTLPTDGATCETRPVSCP